VGVAPRVSSLEKAEVAGRFLYTTNFLTMSTSTALALITGAFTDYGVALLAIFGAVIGIGLGVLVFKFGWKKVKGSTR